MPRPTDLHLNATKVTDAAIKNLAPLLKLKDLGLRGTAVTSAGLEALTQLPALEHLDISVTLVSVAALQEFQKQHPNCNIEAYGTPRPASWRR
jgi:hypothetical protein